MQPSTFFPADGAENVCPDTPLTITFAGPVKLGRAGNIQIARVGDGAVVETIDVSVASKLQAIGGLADFRYYPVTISGNVATIHPRNHLLTYDNAYYVTIDSGAITSESGDYAGIGDAKGWTFKTKGNPPAAGATRLTIAADGTGDFCTLQGAIDFVPDGNTTPTTLFIRKGVYTELIYFNNKNNLTFLGEDRKGSVIEYANNARFNPAGRIYHRGVFLANACHDLVLENLTIRDTTPRGGSQAEAIILNGATDARAILAHVDLYSFQDTLQINGQAYLSDCYIEGDVDFMWGTGPCFFENCHCYGTRSRAYYTQIRNPGTNHGYVYYHCVLDGPAGVSGMYLSRIEPVRFSHSEVVFIDCTMGKSVGDVAWLFNKPRGAAAATVPTENIHFWEYNSHDADGKPVDVSKRLEGSKQLVQPADADAISNYSDASWVLGSGWKPVVPAVPN